LNEGVGEMLIKGSSSAYRSEDTTDQKKAASEYVFQKKAGSG
jgi:hypothetical protein